MRARLSLLVLALGGCGDWDEVYVTNANEIVFGIHQHTDAASGKTEVSAGYDYLSLANKGGSLSYVFRDGDGEGTCYFERFDQRLGHPRVEGGVATWSGGQLPQDGLRVFANEPDPAKHDGTGWADDDNLTFQVSGFAMPPVHTLTMNAPRTNLEVTSITAGAELKSTDDVGVTWTPAETQAVTRVMVSLETEEEGGRGGGLRCFASASSGSAVIPNHWVSRLFASVDPAKPIKGRLEVSSHRQITYVTRGEWIVYVVATSLHREQPFTGVR